jgi:uncharacterized membrane protein YsdA (DUF1294 family)
VKIKLQHHRKIQTKVLISGIGFLLLSYWVKSMALLGLIWINGYGFLLIRYDKKLSIDKTGYRIPEKSFWLIGFALGAFGISMGMIRYRHKTRHFLLKWGIGTMTIIQLIMISASFVIWWGVLK